MDWHLEADALAINSKVIRASIVKYENLFQIIRVQYSIFKFYDLLLSSEMSQQFYEGDIFYTYSF